MKTTQAQREYNRYLKSTHWRAIRAAALFRDGGRCRFCGRGGKGLEAHHLTYERFGREDLNDLLTLCPSCHGAIHQHQPREFNHGKKRKN